MIYSSSRGESLVLCAVDDLTRVTNMEELEQFRLIYLGPYCEIARTAQALRSFTDWTIVSEVLCRTRHKIVTAYMAKAQSLIYLDSTAVVEDRTLSSVT